MYWIFYCTLVLMHTEVFVKSNELFVLYNALVITDTVQWRVYMTVQITLHCMSRQTKFATKRWRQHFSVKLQWTSVLGDWITSSMYKRLTVKWNIWVIKKQGKMHNVMYSWCALAHWQHVRWRLFTMSAACMQEFENNYM